jgi:3D-(3,5/4)-trihydroxycyclohexane-1,2-dione acylhydrolase (decyclizing)
VADARRALDALRAELADWTPPAVAAPPLEVEIPQGGSLPSQGEVLRVLNAAARAGDWVVAAAGSPPGDLLRLWEAPEGSHAHIEFAFSCMGHEIPAGLGIRLAEPDAGEVFVVIGDGTYLMAPSELVTAVQERLAVTVIVLVNDGYQSTHTLQLATVGTSFGNEFGVAVDYAANARSLGAAAWDVRSLRELEGALEEARAHDGPAVVACHVEPRAMLPPSGAWWDLGVARNTELGRAHARGAEAQRWLG